MRAVVALLVATGVARADSDDLVGRAVVLDRGELEGNLTLAINARTGRVGEPASVAPDAWFGVTPRFTVGVIHSARSVDEIAADRAICVNGCAHYAVGLDARYQVRRGLAPRVRLLERDTDPWKPAITLGALSRWHRGRFAITSDPYLRLGLANRDRGNRATVMLPVELAVQPTCRWLLALHAGYDSAVAVARDGWRGPIGVIAGVHPVAPLEIRAELAYRSLVGPQHEFRERVVMLTVGWRQRVR